MLAQLRTSKAAFGLQKNRPVLSRFNVTAPSSKRVVDNQYVRLYISSPSNAHSQLLQRHIARFVTPTIQNRPLSQLNRYLHTSVAAEKKGTTAVRRDRAASAPPSPTAMKSGVVFEKDSRKFFLLLTGVAALQAIFFLGAAEFYWQYDVSIVDGIHSGSGFFERIGWPAFFVGVATFLPITRHFFGSRYVQKLELLPNKQVNVYTYDFLARPRVSLTVPVEQIKNGSFNDQGDYYKFKIRGQRWFFIMDKKGNVPDPAALYDIANGKVPQIKY